MSIELLAFKWLANRISATMIASLAHASSVGVFHFVNYSAHGSTTSDSVLTAASNLNVLANARGTLESMVIEKRRELGLDENGQAFTKSGRAKKVESLAAGRKVTLMAEMVHKLLETYYASTDLYPISGGRYDQDGNHKTHLSQIRPCQACETDVCPDYDHDWRTRGACICGHNALQHWEGTQEGNRDRLIWEFSNKLYPQLRRVNAEGKLKESWYENAKCGDCGCADFGLYGQPGVNAICDCGHDAVRHHGGQPGDWVVYGVSELLVLALEV